MNRCLECGTIEGNWTLTEDDDGNEVDQCESCGNTDCKGHIPEHDDNDMER